ncbi:MAG: DNA-processing protein DprA [bacterium]|nr:DNA-processing protein DprA [bacterium]
MNDKILAFLTLNKIPGLGPVRIKALLNYFKDAEEILRAGFKSLSIVPGIGEFFANNICKHKNEIDIEKELSKIQKDEVKIITLEDDNYPELLKNIFDPPIVLYVKGEIKKEDEKALAIVGSRLATSYGKRVAYDIAKDLSYRGFNIVSGMARGIDTYAHKGALEAKGRTIAVLGCGLDIIYPPENKKLWEEISENGAVITEYPYGSLPEKGNFPRRNRIISGFSKGVLVVEAWTKSGSLITANLALEQGREVFAIPGRIYSKFSQGTHNLIKQGAKLVVNYQDILEEFGLEATQEGSPKKILEEKLLPIERKIYSLINEEPIHVEDLAVLSKENIVDISRALIQMELKGAIRQLTGQRYTLN